ncbi:AraC family transcriptional regulator [candidate division KSB1 bacterium]|nr:AraC family transcriptional regulator [candidate division KSB1 bacterium]
MFSKFIGITPKQYLKTIRFQLSLHKKAQNDKLNITELAYESGYYDQAHLINEFKSLTGQTPKQYFDKNISFSDFFT